MSKTYFPDLPKALARFDQGPDAYREDIAFQRENDQGWERYYDQTPEQRASVFAQISNAMSRGETGKERAFARGWMDAMSCAKAAQTIV